MTDLTLHRSTDPAGKDVASGKRTYTFELRTKTLTYGRVHYRYVDFARAVRR